MSRLFLFILLMSSLQIHAASFSPIDTIPHQTYADYHQRSKHQYTTAIVMVSVGGAACIAGGLLLSTELLAQGTVSYFVGETVTEPIPAGYYVLVVAGGILALCSIPVFKSAGKNRRLANAATLGFNMEKLSNIPTASISKSYFPSIKLNLRL
jgi:hypothetical protein